MIKQLLKNYKQKRNFFLLFLVFFLVSTFILFYSSYKENTHYLEKTLNNTLQGAARNAALLLGERFFDKATQARSVSEQEDKNNIFLLSQLAKNSHVAYVYSFAFKDNTLHFTSSSATDKELKNQDYTKYWDTYEDATQKLRNIAKTKKLFYEVSTDKWGSFKSVLIPMETKNHTFYVVGADIRTNAIDAAKQSFLEKNILFVVVILFALFFLWIRFVALSKKEFKLIKNIHQDLHKTIQEKTQKLQELNENLEQKVQQEVEKNREKEKHLLQQSKLMQMSEMIRMIAHQWRQPLNTLSVVYQTLYLKYKRGKLDDQQMEDFVQKSQTHVNAMSKIIDDFTKFFQPDEAKKEFSLNETLQHLFVMTQTAYKQEGIEIELQNTKEQLIVYGFENEFLQVLLNILDNAKDAILKTNPEKKTIKIALEQQENKAVICIEDYAGGIEEAVLEKVFEPYFSTKENLNGTGLGLYIAKMIIEEHMQGKITLHNTQEGVKVCVYLQL